MRKLSLGLTLVLLSYFFLGCLEVQKSNFKLEYSRTRDQGSFKQEFQGIKDPSPNSNIGTEKKGLNEMLDHIKTVLKSLGLKDVKGEVKFNPKNKTHDAYLTGKFFSLGHLPFFNSIKLSFEDADEKIDKISYGRLDQIIEFNINSKDLIATGAKSAFIFKSTDNNAIIISAEPKGVLSNDRKTVTWKINKKNKKTNPYKVRLKGKKYKNI